MCFYFVFLFFTCLFFHFLFIVYLVYDFIIPHWPADSCSACRGCRWHIIRFSYPFFQSSPPRPFIRTY